MIKQFWEWIKDLYPTKNPLKIAYLSIAAVSVVAGLFVSIKVLMGKESIPTLYNDPVIPVAVNSEQPTSGRDARIIPSVSNEYIATFIANEELFNTQTFTPDVSDVLNGGTPTKAGRTFEGWETSDDSPIYYNGYPVKLNNSITFYAVWRVNGEEDSTTSSISNEYTATFIANEEPFNTQTFTPDVSDVLNGGTPAKDGYTFEGWAASADELIYYNGYTVKLKDNITFYAVWRVN